MGVSDYTAPVQNGSSISKVVVAFPGEYLNDVVIYTPMLDCHPNTWEMV